MNQHRIKSAKCCTVRILFIVFVLSLFTTFKSIAQPAICPGLTLTITNVYGSGPTYFQWHDQCTTIVNYEIQVLRLYNTDPFRINEDDILAKIDWSQATSIFTEKGVNPITGNKTFYITLAEGTGYYAWRIRRIDGYGYTAPSFPWFLDLWTNTGAIVDGATVPIDPTYDLSNTFVFFYNQFEQDKNWVYRRSFGDSRGDHHSAPRINEKIDYANYLLMPIQHQEMYGWFGRPTVSQTVIDYSGRPSFTSLKGFSWGWLDYKNNYLESANTSQAYTADDFDWYGTYNNPFDVNGSLSDYYSDNNPDIRIPSAMGKPYSRTLYYNDGLNRVREIVTPGFAHAADVANDPDNSSANTIRKSYSKATDAELIRMFGDEAPEGDYIEKITTIDPNKGYSIEYRDEMDRVIATAMTTPRAPNLDAVRDATNPVSVVDTIRKITQVGPNRLMIKGTYSFAQPTSLDYFFHLEANKFGDECIQVCGSCDYKLTLIGTDRDDTSGFKITRLLIPDIDSNGICSGYTYDTSGTYDQPSDPIAPGTYDVSVFLETNVPDPVTGKTFADSVVQVLKTKLFDKIFKGPFSVLPSNQTKEMDVVRTYLDNDDINGLMIDYLDVDTNLNLFQIRFNHCATLKLPIVFCPIEDCDPPLFAEYMKDMMAKDDQITGTTYFANAYANTGTGGIAFTTHIDNLFVVANDAEFNIIINNMLVDGYSCNKLWEAWRNTVHTFIKSQKALTSGASQLLSTAPKFDWWEHFMKQVGYKIAFEARQYSELGTNTVISSTLVRRKPYRYFPYNWTSKMAVEDMYCYIGTGNTTCASPSTGTTSPGGWVTGLYNFPTHDPSVNTFHMYNFYKAVKGGLSHTLFPGAINTGSVGAQALGQIKNACINSCDGRLDGLVTDVVKHYMDTWQLEVEGFAYDNWRPTPVGTVMLDNIYCKAYAVVEACKSKCDVAPDSSGYLSVGKIQTIQNAMAAPIEIYARPPGVADSACIAGFEDVPNITYNRTDALVDWLNYKQAVVRDSFYSRGYKGFKWNPLQYGGSLLGPLGNPPCDSMDGIFRDTTNISFFSSSKRHLKNQPLCVGKPLSFTREMYDTVYINSDNMIDIVLYFNLGLAANDSFVWVEEVPPGFTIVSAPGRIVGNKIHYAVAGPRAAGTSLSLAYMVKAPSAPITEYVNGGFYSYIGGVLTDSCKLINDTIRVDTCISIARTAITINSFNQITENIITYSCPTCIDIINCSGRVCMRFVDAPVLTDTTLAVVSCGAALCRQFEDALDNEMLRVFNIREAELRKSYETWCTRADSITAFLAHEYEVDNFLHTLYYYDRAGNLVRTVQRGTSAVDNPSSTNIPIDRTTNPLVDEPTTTIWNEYDYSTTGRLLRSETRDGGNTLYLYDKLGRLRVSQNAKQKPYTKWSYSRYDALGRVIESGEMVYASAGEPTDIEIDDPTFPSLSNGASSLHDVTFTVYTDPYPVGTGTYPLGSNLNGVTLFPLNGGTLDGPSPFHFGGTHYTPDSSMYQHHIRNRVSYTIQDHDGNLTPGIDYNRVINVYSYDPHGNVEYYYTYIPGMPKVKLVLYENAITEGKPYSIQFLDADRMPDPVDNYFNRFVYNPDGVLTGMRRGYFTIKPPASGTSYKDFEKTEEMYNNVDYFYNPHDYSLRRMHIGTLQGLDYIYTLEGWLKAVNHGVDTSDPGNDYEYWPGYVVEGSDGVDSSSFRKDAFSEVLYYYDGDFTRMSSPFNTNTTGSFPLNPELVRNNASGNNRELYDGNIAAAQSYVSAPAAGATPGNVFDEQMGYRYEYDELNRLKLAHSTHQYNSLAWIPNNNTTAGNINEQYKENFEYDKYGMVQIGRYTARNTGASGTINPRLIDHASLGRNYNKVMQIMDNQADITGLDIPSETAIEYDAIGNVIKMDVKNYDTSISDSVSRALLEDYTLYITWNVQNKVSHIGMRNHMNNDTVSFKYLYDAQGNRVKQTERLNTNTDYMIWTVRAADGKEIAIYENDFNGDPVIEERYLYGLDRIGFVKGPNPVAVGQATDLPDVNYELKDHSGNVRVVFSENSVTSHPAPPAANVINQYYAFGSLQPYRTYLTPNYRMGFNGQVRDDNVMGTTGVGKLNYAKYWMYNPHYALRWNMDPKTKSSQNP